ncbi:MAG: dolichyl-P-Man:Man(7)GlcNAc(2)-PP-dolichol alpha-1,6-mannosyltransferase [Peltula sp. TS41687]|nr:MAG: dolichyl-P-Man:Man(7)GlcNAc(2)-PP-dolichol alpha-1,6-mannosyltransferase [Peltula sp. TS41687]
MDKASASSNRQSLGFSSRATDTLLSLLLPSLILLHLVLSPHTKVEESFNLQATHDILTHGIPTKYVRQRLKEQYDHFSFPGVVPRTFTGALLLATFSQVGIYMGLNRQIVVRGVLGLLNASALLAFRRAVARSFGRDTGNWYLLLQACQFHVIYYASRTLPNMFAFGLTTLALSRLLPTLGGSFNSAAFRKSCRLSVYILTFTAVVFRSEIAVLLAVLIACLFLREGMVIFQDIVLAGTTGAVIGLLVTISVDSFFWLKFPLWPELAGFKYNAIEGKSSAWGTNPWWFYFGNALPRLLLNPMSWLVCIPLAAAIPATRIPTLDILAPVLGFMAIYSIQPHKEWRFVIYAIPSLTAAAAIGANWIWTRKSKTILYRVLSLALVWSTLASFAISFSMLAISRLNYPGAEAIHRVHQLGEGSAKVVRVHMDTLSCTTGITRFLEKPPPDNLLGSNQTLWIYDKTEEESTLLDPSFWDKFDYALAESPERVIEEWEIVDTIEALIGVTIMGPDGGEKEKVTSDKNTVTVKPLKITWLTNLDIFLRRHITKGWWLGIKLKPKIRIMRNLRMLPG